MNQGILLLEPDRYYHIYNHANGFENIFIDDHDRLNFIEKYKKYIIPIADTFAYCLMPNHFHVLIRIKSIEELHSVLQIKQNDQNGSAAISYRFSHFFNSYSQSFNKKHKRMGGLFKNRFGRKWVDKEKYFQKMIHYIHSNPVEHGFVERISEWEFSSYSAILGTGQTLIRRDEVIDCFGDLNNFIYVHRKPFEK